MIPTPFRIGRGQRGISLIEGVLYLVIALAVIVGGIVFFQQAQLSTQVDSAARAMTSASSQLLDTETRTPSVDASSPAASLSSYAMDAGILPPSTGGTDGTPTLPWGGPLDLWAFSTNVGGRQVPAIVAVMHEVPTEACVRLSGIDATGQGPVGVSIVGMETADFPSTTDPMQFVTAMATSDTATLYASGTDTSAAARATACEGAEDILVTYRR